MEVIEQAPGRYRPLLSTPAALAGAETADSFPRQAEGDIDSRVWCGDVGLLGPDHGQGAKYLLLPPDYRGETPAEYLPFRSRTYRVFVFWRGFFKDPKQLDEPVKVMEQTRVYPLGQEASAKPMQFPDASAVPANMLYPTDGTAFDMLARFIAHEYVEPADMEMRGMLAALGIEKNKPFEPDAHRRDLLDKGAKTAYRIAHLIIYSPLAIIPNALWYKDRRWANVFPGNATFTAPTFNYVGQSSPGEGKNWLKTLPDRGFFVILRLYGPTRAFFDQSWKPSDIEKLS